MKALLEDLSLNDKFLIHHVHSLLLFDCSNTKSFSLAATTPFYPEARHPSRNNELLWRIL
jgi:hypothetical protein